RRTFRCSMVLLLLETVRGRVHWTARLPRVGEVRTLERTMTPWVMPPQNSEHHPYQFGRDRHPREQVDPRVPKGRRVVIRVSCGRNSTARCRGPASGARAENTLRRAGGIVKLRGRPGAR